MKKFNTNKEVIYAFLNQCYLEGENYQSTLSFKNNLLFSYSSLLAILDSLNSVILIDANIRKYSITTQKQTGVLLNRIPNSYAILSHPLKISPAETLQWYWDQIENSIGCYNRAFLHKDKHKHNIENLMEQSKKYIEYELETTKTLTLDSKVVKYKVEITKKLFKNKIL